MKNNGQIEVKKNNKSKVFRYIYHTDGITRQMIADRIGISLPTVNSNLMELMDEGLIKYYDCAESTGGRKPQNIVADSDYAFVVSVNIKMDFVFIKLIDFKGEIRDEVKIDINFADSVEYDDVLVKNVKEIVEKNKADITKILGTAISIPGVFERSGDIVIEAPTLSIKNYSVKRLTELMSYKPVVIDNDAKAGAYTEIWHRKRRRLKKAPEEGKPDYLLNSVMPYGGIQIHGLRSYLLLDKGIGGAIIQGDACYKGRNNRAGEFGHMQLVHDGKLCGCGRKGCVEAYISTDRLSKDFNMELKDFFEAVKKGNQKYIDALNQYLQYLVQTIVMIYTIFDSPITVGGQICEYLVDYRNEINKMIGHMDGFKTTDVVMRMSYDKKVYAIDGIALKILDDFIANV